MTKQNQGPGWSKSQEIGQRANTCFVANRPQSWLVTPLSGDEDLGFDYQVQTTIGGIGRDAFRVQLKGSEAPELNSSGEFFSIALNTRTVRFYQTKVEPILLVLADLSVNSSPKNCLLYYTWIQDELRRANIDGLSDEQESVKFRIPTANVLTEQSDLNSDIARMVKLGKIGDSIDIDVEKKLPQLSPFQRADLISQMPDQFIQRGPDFIETMALPPESAWLNPPAGGFPWQLKEADHHLRGGAADLAETSLNAAEKLIGSATDIEVAEYWFLRGRVAQFMCSEEIARDCFERAVQLPNPHARYLSAWAEAEIRLAIKQDDPQLSMVIERLVDEAPQIKGIKARALGAAGRLDEGIALAKSFEGAESLVALAILHMMKNEFNLVLDVCEQGLALNNPKKIGHQVFLMMRARARFSLAIGIRAEDHDIELPPSGPSRTSVDQLRLLWQDTQEAVEEFKRAGWPPNVDYLADIWSAAAIMLGKQEEALPSLMAAGKARPNLSNLQKALETVAAHCNELSVALEANKKLPFSDTNATHRILALHGLRKDQDCVNFFREALPKLSKESVGFGDATLAAILSAHRSVETSLKQEWLELLSSTEKMAPFRALADYFLAVEDNQLASDAELEVLEDRYEQLGRPYPIAIQLVSLYDPSIRGQAEKSVAVAQRVRERALLPLRIALHQGQALATLNRWDDLLALCDEALDRFEDHHKMNAFRALGLENLGRTAEAMDTLTSLVHEDSADAVAINTYINIAIRCGFEAEALTTAQALFAKAATRTHQLNCLRLLFSLSHMSSPSSPKSLEFAQRYGELCKQDDELEEGAFLSMMLVARVAVNRALSPEEMRKFEARLNAYAQAYPDSKVLRRGQVSNDATPAEAFQLISEIAGIDQDKANFAKKIERELQNGKIALPFSWRPKHALSGVPNIVILWEVAKCRREEEKQYQLIIAGDHWRPTTTSTIVKIPLLDHVALLVAFDLGIFELLFELFPQIAISQATIAEISRLATPLLGGPAYFKCAAIQAALKRNFKRIRQPRASRPNHMDVLDWPSEETVLLAQCEEYILYSDDALFRLYSERDAESAQSLCSLDVIDGLVDLGLISLSDASKKIAQLCEWRVGIVITFRYQRGILPPALLHSRSLDDGVKLLRADTNAIAVFNGIWGYEKSFTAMVAQAGDLLRELINDTSLPNIAIASLLALWHGKIKLRQDSPGNLQALAFLATRAASVGDYLSEEAARRITQIYRLLIEGEHGPRMDERKEMEGLLLLGQFAAGIDKIQTPKALIPLAERLGAAFTKGTAEYEAFQKGLGHVDQSNP